MLLQGGIVVAKQGRFAGAWPAVQENNGRISGGDPPKPGALGTAIDGHGFNRRDTARYDADRWGHLAWQVPLVTSAITFILATGFSTSNQDIRPGVQAIGLVLLALWTVMGFGLTAIGFRAVADRRSALRHATIALVLNTMLGVATAVGIVAAYAHSHERRVFPERSVADYQALAHAARINIWIDTDPACIGDADKDPDDCWALLTALHSPRLAVRGISTVFGNLSGERTHVVAEQLLRRFAASTQNAHPLPIYQGASYAGAPAWLDTPASTALARELAVEPLTILALGPLTNIATVLVDHPELAPRIERVILVGGKSPGRLLHPGTQWWFHFRDLNVSKDTRAMRTLLYSGVRLVLIPFDAAQHMTVTARDLNRVATAGAAARWLAGQSRSWLDFWQDDLHRKGFYPFDLLAAGYAIAPHSFDCSVRRARMGFSVFLEPFGMGRDLEVGADLPGPQVLYCTTIDAGLKSLLLERLMTARKA